MPVNYVVNWLFFRGVYAKACGDLEAVFDGPTAGFSLLGVMDEDNTEIYAAVAMNTRN
ncbi:hypothetical protein [Teredinibacter purpureus]|uniref:hypothetical protein n=1 Tax=Teredinibacter purpureus TaxID=2731756 RepID=UPI0013C4CAC9|nr:hypothetical protein [Teredinibacter purpureus]